MLVGALEVERGRPLQLRPLLEHGGVGAAALEPDVEDVVDLLVVGGVVGVAQEVLRVARPPGVGTLGLEGRGDPLDHLRVAQRLARLPVHEHAIGTPQARWRETHQSGRLSIIERMRLLPRAGHAAGGVDGGQRLLAQPVRALHRDEPLAVARKISGALERQECG